MKVLQPGASTPTVFLDIHTKVVAGGEQGLLGLAFHPQYATNGRFFVYYTRAGDGTIVIAEYHVSADPNVADPTETVILTIPHPTNTNHNGGMLAFGPDGYLYIGVGDGGGGNDPPNNAQNINVLLGKILRIDVDAPAGSACRTRRRRRIRSRRHAGARRDLRVRPAEPVALQLRPDHAPQWVARRRAGGARGGGHADRRRRQLRLARLRRDLCTNNDPALCSSPQNYIFPIFDYAHSGGRCSITGGYVYRGSQGALPVGTYVYGDYCSGEIFGWNGSTPERAPGHCAQHLLVRRGRGGRALRRRPRRHGAQDRASAPCTYAISPTSGLRTRGRHGKRQCHGACRLRLDSHEQRSWLAITGGASGSGNGTVIYSVAPYTGQPKKRAGR